MTKVKIKNRKIVAIIILVIMASIFTLQYNNNFNQDSQNSIEMYADDESISILEEDSFQNENSHIFKSSSNFKFNMYKVYVLVNICCLASIFKLKYTAIISKIYSIYNYSVFVVFFTNKKDGKKRILCVCS